MYEIPKNIILDSEIKCIVYNFFDIKLGKNKDVSDLIRDINNNCLKQRQQAGIEVLEELLREDNDSIMIEAKILRLKTLLKDNLTN